MKSRLPQYLLAAALLALTAFLTSCNTVKGLGTDIHDSSQHVQDWMEGK